MPSDPEPVLRHYMYEQAEVALNSIPTEERSDVYVVSFFVYDEEDDSRRPTLTIGTNTESQAACVQGPDFHFPGDPRPSRAADPEEARWNYAFWLQNRYAVIGGSSADPGGAGLVEAWVRATGRWAELPDPMASDDVWSAYIRTVEGITEDFVGLAVELAQRLHADRVVETVFGRPVPVVVHELEYYDTIASQTAQANPPGLADEFVSWVMAMYE